MVFCTVEPSRIIAKSYNCTIFIKGIGNMVICVKLFQIKTSVSGDAV